MTTSQLAGVKVGSYFCQKCGTHRGNHTDGSGVSFQAYHILRIDTGLVSGNCEESGQAVNLLLAVALLRNRGIASQFFFGWLLRHKRADINTAHGALAEFVTAHLRGLLFYSSIV